MTMAFGTADAMLRLSCGHLESPGYTNIALSIFILIGILVSYLPQHHRIISRRSSEGISPYFVLLGTTSGTSAFANILLLSKNDILCCKSISSFECFAGTLGVAQVGMQWTCFAIILFLFLIFFPRATPLDSRKPGYNPALPTYKTAVAVAILCVLHGVFIGVVSIFYLVKRPASMLWWANFLGIQATILASIQYFPQLWTTFRLKHVGSLSIPMMLIQTPGSFVWAGSLFARLGKQGWSAWGVYVVTGSLQGSLLVMAIYFELKERKRQKETSDEHSNGNGVRSTDPDDEGGHNVEGEDSDSREGFSTNYTERTPLLSS